MAYPVPRLVKSRRAVLAPVAAAAAACLPRPPARHRGVLFGGEGEGRESRAELPVDHGPLRLFVELIVAVLALQDAFTELLVERFIFGFVLTFPEADEFAVRRGQVIIYTSITW